MTSKVLQSASSPHAKSIGSFLDAVLEMIGSDTDYSNYFKQKPGLDYAFYSDRYLYHTAKDDLQHSSLYSAQFLCDTMYDAIKGMHPKSLSTFVKSPVVFYSIFSLSYVSVSKTWYMVSYALLVTVVGLSCFGSYLFTRRNDEETARSHLLESIWAFSIVCLAFLASILFSVAVGGIKTYLNHGSSYGYPEIGLVTTCLQTFAICIIIDLLIKRSRARDVARDPESDVAAVQKDYTMVGNFLFFTLSSITAIFCGFFGIDIVYLPLYWTIFSGVSLVGTLGMSQLAPQVAESVPELFSLIPIFGTLVLPFSLTFDMIHMLLISLPSTIGDGIPDYVCDTIWVPLIFPIATVSTVIKRPKYLLLGLMAAWAILYTTSLALFPFTGERPFKYSYSEVWDVTTRASSQYTTVAVVTMAHISGLKWVNQIWDPRSPFYNQTVSDQSNNHFEFKSSNLPVFNRTVDTDTLIGLSIQYGPEVSTFRLTLTAPVESRMLKLEWAHTSPDFAIWLDPDHYSRWTNQSKPGSTSTFDPSIPMYIMRRSHQEKTMIHVRATDPFLLTVTAYMDLKLSTNWPLQTPEWSIPCRTTDGGGLGIVRQFSVG